MSHRIVLAGRIAVHDRDTVMDERALPGRQLRLVFAMLVMARGQSILRDEFADNLWPEQRPHSWPVALRGLVSQLRGFVVASGLGSRERLHAEAGGYRLLLQDTPVDLHEATWLAEDAAKALTSGKLERAVGSAIRARAILVRPLLAGIDGPWVEEHRRGMAAELLRTIDVLARARGRLGQHDRAAAAAEAAISLDPFRETSHRLLLRSCLDAGDHMAGLRAYERVRTLLAEELGADPSPETQALHLALLRYGSPAPRGPASQPSGSQGGSISSSPYLGLRTFDEADASRFFGRNADVSRLLERLGSTRFLAVLGASGSGKSSLVRAGLVPALRRGALPGSDSWRALIIRPGAQPVRELATALTGLDRSDDTGALHHRLERDAMALHRTVGRLMRDAPDTDRLLLVVDQLEEAFSLCSDSRQRQAFLDALAAAVRIADGRVAVVTTLRADFYPRLSEHPAFSDLASAHQFLVTPMDEVGLSLAIEGPARAADVHLEAGLTETILRDVARRPGSLPLLSHALLELWQRSSGSTLTVADYDASGGVEGAVAQRAETVHGQLTGKERAVAKRILLRLTQPGDGSPDTRRRVALRELVPGPDERAAVEQVIETLATARLVTLGANSEGEPAVEVSHEALIQGWPRLRSWIDEDREGLMIHRRLTASAAEWERLARDEGALYRGAQLAVAAAWAERDPSTTNQLERDFLAACLEAHVAQRRGRLRRLRATAAALAVGVLVTAGLALFAFGQAERLAGEVRVATARELAAFAVADLDVDPERSILLALDAVAVTYEVDGTVVREAEEVLRRALKGSRVVLSVPQGGWGLAVSSDGSRFVTTGSDPTDNTATVWDTRSGGQLLSISGPDGGRTTADLSADDRLIATAHDDGTARVWDAATGEPVQVMSGHQDAVGYATFSPDGRRLVTGSDDLTVRVWDVDTGGEVLLLEGFDLPPYRPVFSIDGTQVAAIDGTEVRLHDAVTGELQLVFTGHEWPVRWVTYSPDGSSIASAGLDGTLRVWGTASGAELTTFRHPTGVDAVAFHPDGSRIAAAGHDSTVRLWDVATGEELLTLAGHVGFIVNLMFTPDGDGLFTAAFDGSTRLWDTSIAGAREWLTVPGAIDIFPGVVFDPDGTSFAASADPFGVSIWDSRTGQHRMTLTDGNARFTSIDYDPGGRILVASSDLSAPRVWDVTSGDLLLELGGPDGVVARTVAFSPDGQTIAAGSQDGTARWWDTDTGTPVGSIDTGSGDVLAVAWSPDGSLLVTGGANGEVIAWDATTLERVQVLQANDEAVEGLAFGADGRLVTAGTDAIGRVWDLDEGTLLAELRGHTAVVSGVAMSPDGASIATVSDDGTARLWDADDGRELLTLFGHRRLVFGVAFSPDGRLLATASVDGTVAVHVLPLDELVALARERVTRQLSDDECERLPWAPSCTEQLQP